MHLYLQLSRTYVDVYLWSAGVSMAVILVGAYLWSRRIRHWSGAVLVGGVASLLAAHGYLWWFLRTVGPVDDPFLATRFESSYYWLQSLGFVLSAVGFCGFVACRGGKSSLTPGSGQVAIPMR